MATIKLRTLEPKDAPLMLEWMHDTAVNQFFKFDFGKSTLDTVTDFITTPVNDTINFAIDNGTGEYLGTVSLKHIDSDAKNAEYAIVLRKSAQGLGAGKAATTLILDCAFSDLNLNRVYLNVLSDNENAICFYERFGFVYEGEFVNHINIRNELHSLKWYRILKDEWKSLKEKRG